VIRLGYDFDRFVLSHAAVIKYGAAGHFVTRRLPARQEPYVVLPSTFGVDAMVVIEKSAYLMPDDTPVDVRTRPS
jgi:hypothetical protein